MNLDTQITHCADMSAHWYVQDGVIRVTRWRDIYGNVTPLPHPSLGECCDELPRSLWETIRRDYDNLRTPAPKPQRRSIFEDVKR